MKIFPDKPGKVQNLAVKSTTENSVALEWEDPEDDGGCLITQYIVEKRAASKRNWESVGKFEEMECEITRLTEGKNYSFRVAAVNQIGAGEFSELSKSVQAKIQAGKPKYHNFCNYCSI